LKSSNGEIRTLSYLFSRDYQCSFIYSNVQSTNPFLKLLSEINSDCKINFPQDTCNNLLDFYGQSNECKSDSESSGIPNWAIALIILAVIVVFCLIVIVAMVLTNSKRK